MLCRRRGVAMLVSLLCVPLAAAQAAEIPDQVLRGLTHSADLIVTGTVTQVIPPLPDVEQRERGTQVIRPTRVRFAVELVLIGERELAGETITIAVDPDSKPMPRAGDTKRLLFLQASDAEGYALVYWERYGHFLVERGRVLARFAALDTDEEAPPALRDLYTLLREWWPTRVTLDVRIPRQNAIVEAVLPVTFTFKNRGTRPIKILPPSATFNTIEVRRLRASRWDPGRDPWTTVGHWPFMEDPEKPLLLEPGAQLTLRYPVPLRALEILERGVYRITVQYRPYRPSRWFKRAMVDDAWSDLWLGAPPAHEQIVVVK